MNTTICKDCGKTVHLSCWPFCPHEMVRNRDAEISERDATVIFKKPDGTFSYPMQNNKPTPPGCRRIVLNSLRKIEQHEREAGVRSEMAHFDKGTGRGFDSTFNGKPYN